MVNEVIVATLSRLWEEALGEPVTDVDADFFELGGDSLMALTIATRAIDAGIPMPRSGVLRRSTIRELAEAVENPALFEHI
ncbi:phosphopantetheine-binding protein [Streptomyces cinnamoneus]|uniref:phosphopantetheine-binding protein n=1 Tax=Streptomyces cinnamoneus TaxID=53446 RepID=UPI003433F2B6